MSSIPLKHEVPQDFCLLQEAEFSDPSDEDRPNRLCICLSDVHFTDGTVGNQGADAVIWREVFERIKDLCVGHEIDELTIVLAGDVADMIRSAAWSQNDACTRGSGNILASKRSCGASCKGSSRSMPKRHRPRGNADFFICCSAFLPI